jgi:hypothetical protein
MEQQNTLYSAEQTANHTHTMEQQTPAQPKQPAVNRKAVLRSLAISLIINAAFPIIIYNALKTYTNVSDFVALLATGVPSIIDSLVGIVRRKRIDFLAGFTLVTIAVSLIVIALGSDPKVYLVRESFFTAAFGIAYLVSLPFPKPLAYYFARQFAAGNTPEGIAWFEQKWQDPRFRRTLRLIGLYWSIGLLLEAVLRFYLVFTLSVQQFLFISPFVFYGITGLLLAGQFLFIRRMRNRMAAQ